jgi:hypothetical protein
MITIFYEFSKLQEAKESGMESGISHLSTFLYLLQLLYSSLQLGSSHHDRAAGSAEPQLDALPCKVSRLFVSCNFSRNQADTKQ